MSRAYYNENDAFAAEWLRRLIARNLIAPGLVDERSILEVQPHELDGFTQCHFFAGIGGWSYALRLAGIPDDRPLWTGSCPCQPFSVAGAKRGSEDERHLWPAWFRLIGGCRPGLILGEQVAGSAGLAWIDHVCLDLEGAGYAAAAANLCAAGAGAPHIRQRLYWVAYDEAPGRSLERGDGIFDVQRPAQRDDADRCGEDESRGLADAQSRRLDGIGGGPDDAPAAGGSGRPDAQRCGQLGDSEREGQQGREPSHLSGTWRGSQGGEPEQSGGEHRAWTDIEWIACRDGKNRPTQPGIFPLASRLPKGVVRGGDSGAPLDADDSAQARVMRLRGYGNSIVPQVAESFIRSFMECLP